MKSLIIAAVAGLAAPLAAQAQSLSPVSVYGSLGYGAVDASVGGFGGDFSAAQARLGARFGQYLGVEGEVAKGFKGDSCCGGVEGPAKTKLDSQLAAYAVGYLPIKPNFDLIARVGYGATNVDAKFSVGGNSITYDSLNQKSWNYGAGAQYFFDAKNGVRGDYTRYNYKYTDQDADVWSVAYVRKF